MQISENGIRFIESFEGFSSKVYNDVGHPAVGYGHDLQPGESFPDGITQPEAEALLIQDVNTRYAPVVNSLITSDCTQNQFDALVSFTFNEGVGNLLESSMHTYFNMGNKQGAAKARFLAAEIA